MEKQNFYVDQECDFYDIFIKSKEKKEFFKIATGPIFDRIRESINQDIFDDIWLLLSNFSKRFTDLFLFILKTKYPKNGKSLEIYIEIIKSTIQLRQETIDKLDKSDKSILTQKDRNEKILLNIGPVNYEFHLFKKELILFLSILSISNKCKSVLHKK